ncbi:MAG TPA: hypothetical protein VJV78_11160, partial [Polyangiales bacterium]|nr:hypothetical protein [Polyangiales bacterium]
MSALTSLLVRDEVVSVRQIEDAIARQVLEGGELDTALLELDAVPENVLNAYRAASYRLPAVARDEVMSVSAATLSLITEGQAQRLRIIPITHDATTLVVASAQPLPEAEREGLSEAIGMRIESCVCCEIRIEAALAHHYGAVLSPRLSRLAERVEQLEPGILPLVEAMQETPISGLAAELFDDMDEGDELEEEPAGATPIAHESLRAPPPQEVSVGRVVEVRPSQLPPAESVRAGAAAEPGARHDTQRGVGHSSVPAPGETQLGVGPRSAPPLTSVPVPSNEVRNSLGASRSSRAANDVVFSKPARRPKRGPAVPQGPLTRELASQLLERADDRDAVIEVFFRYARQYFEATALCSVREDRVVGREVHNVPNLTDIHGLMLSVQRGSGLEEVLRTLQPRVDDMSRKAEDQPLVEALRRMACQPSALLPVCIKRRVVAIIYGDRGGDYFQRSDLAQLVELLPEVSRAFERIIRTRKVLGLSTRGQALASARAELGHAQTQLDVTPVKPSAPSTPSEPPDHTKTEAL